MFYRFALFLIFACNLSFAQLSVRNNTYIFVNDQIVFVEDDVNLNEANSRIYLRNEAQLIQGAGATGNSGVGELSVYQNGNVGEYEYNYWCSPIGSKPSSSVNNPFGISFLNDVIGLITSTPATFTHSGNYNGTSSPLNIEPYWIWKFIASDNYYEWIHVQGNTTLNPGEGFTMKGTVGSGDNQLYDFRGKPNKGTIAVSVLNGKTTLVGNPYPSAIDAAAYIHDVENAAVITGVLHYWEQDPSVNSHEIRAYDGGYATYTINATGTVETFISAVFNTYNGNGSINVNNTGIGSKTAKRYIPIGQGFMVEGTATGTVKAKNSHRVYIKESAANSEFFKTTNTKGKTTETENIFFEVPNDYKRFRLNIDFNNTYTRQIVETFHATATDGFDYGLETNIKPEDIISSDAYWLNNNTPYLAQAISFNETLQIPLVIKLAKNMPVRIRIADIQNFESNLPIYIHDKENNIYVNLKNQVFNMNLDAGNYTNRFEVTFNKNTLNIVDTTFEDFKVFQNNNRSQLKILNPNRLKISAIRVFDVSGKLVLNKRLSNAKKQYSYSTKSFSDGIYIAKIQLSNSKVFSKKIVVSNKN
jgi:hypothetical protein